MKCMNKHLTRHPWLKVSMCEYKEAIWELKSRIPQKNREMRLKRKKMKTSPWSEMVSMARIPNGPPIVPDLEVAWCQFVLIVLSSPSSFSVSIWSPDSGGWEGTPHPKQGWDQLGDLEVTFLLETFQHQPKRFRNDIYQYSFQKIVELKTHKKRHPLIPSADDGDWQVYTISFIKRNMDEFKERFNEYFTWSIKMKEIEGEKLWNENYLRAPSSLFSLIKVVYLRILWNCTTLWNGLWAKLGLDVTWCRNQRTLPFISTLLAFKLIYCVATYNYRHHFCEYEYFQSSNSYCNSNFSVKGAFSVWAIRIWRLGLNLPKCNSNLSPISVQNMLPWHLVWNGTNVF